jgi:hypothetical protein
VRRWVTAAVVFVVATVLVALLIASFRTVWWWFEVHTGTVNEGGPYYGFWSGFGSDLGEAAIIVGGVQLLRRANCHTRRCYRIGHKVTDPASGHEYRQCVRHDPHVRDHAHAHWWQHHYTDEHLSSVHARITEQAANHPTNRGATTP